MGNTAFAKAELERAGFFKEDSDYNGGLGQAVMELMEVFDKQGHSGASAPATISLFSKVANFQPILPITGEDDEWMEVSGAPDYVYQNNRCSAVFKHGQFGRAYYLDAIVWRTQKGSTFGGSTKDGLSSRQFIKQFPFVPKTFYVDVIETEVEPDDWEFTIKDQSQVDAVFEYYDRFHQ